MPGVFGARIVTLLCVECFEPLFRMVHKHPQDNEAKGACGYWTPPSVQRTNIKQRASCVPLNRPVHASSSLLNRSLCDAPSLTEVSEEILDAFEE
jgi:hypothetical protein